MLSMIVEEWSVTLVGWRIYGRKERETNEFIKSFVLLWGSYFNRSMLKSSMRKQVLACCRDSSRFWLIVERLITIENKSLTEIASDLQPERFLSKVLTNLRAGS